MIKKQWYHSVHKAHLSNFTGNWCITDDLTKMHILFIEDVLPLCSENKIKTVQLKTIGWKDKQWFPNKWDGERYDAADVKYPGIITNGPNPHDNKYRMLDGRRRLHKLLTAKVKSSEFYILDWKDVLPLFIDKEDPIVEERVKLRLKMSPMSSHSHSHSHDH